MSYFDVFAFVYIKYKYYCRFQKGCIYYSDRIKLFSLLFKTANH